MKDEPDVRMGIWFDLRDTEDDDLTKQEWDDNLWRILKETLHYMKHTHGEYIMEIDGELDMNLEELLENK